MPVNEYASLDAVNWEMLKQHWRELEAERDTLKARLAELEAGAAKMREAAESALAKLTEHGGAFDWSDQALVFLEMGLSSAGRETAERLKRLEALEDKARGVVVSGDFLLHHLRENAMAEEVPPSFRTRLDELKVALRALEGGGQG